jgi:hypothetical protein
MSEFAYVQPVPIPEDLRAVLFAKLSEKEVSAWATEALVVEAARDHIISRRKAATLLGLNNYVQRQAFFQRHGLTSEYTLEMLEMDRRALQVLHPKP